MNGKLYVLIGEYKGDYDDFYERPTESIAASKNLKKVEKQKEILNSEGHDFVDFRVEEVEDLDYDITQKARAHYGWPTEQK